ncbi:acetyl-CoA C-acyltransferase [Ideonella sp. BN130291]|uniref:acetyl-CoA C-acyltransferase n=1 Tax=Ideonella sp. BN130291 TaxID=3112940 RepID=UPI002E26EE9F|nr:acetyl-CoA C-acyltransferase [Ideonella sp. BN130291]
MPERVVIVSAARTPLGGLLGDLAGLPAWELGAAAIAAAVQRAGVPRDSIDEVLMGNCLMAGQGQAPARQAARRAGLPDATGAVTLSKVCGAGMRAAMFAHDMLLAGSADVLVAGGMESMSNAPHLAHIRKGVKAGSTSLLDHMAYDGLEDAYEPGKPMGLFGEECALRYGFSREAMDRFAIASVERSQRANEDGSFEWEIAPVPLKGGAGSVLMSRDERPFKLKVDKIPSLKPAFREDGRITAASSSSNADGAAALVLMRESDAQRQSLAPLARIVAHSVHAQEPRWFTTAPIGAIHKLLDRAGWSSGEVDLWEVNEAFAAVPMAVMHEFKLGIEQMNVHGGACALGHPIGASGARIVVTLLGALRQRGLKRGVASLCIGGGEATAMALELL